MIKLRHLLEELYVPGFASSKTTKPFKVPENFDIFEEGNGWSAYRGGNDWENGVTGVCAYIGPEGYHREQARIWFEVQFPKEISEYVDSSKAYQNVNSEAVKNWGEKASKTWMREVRRIHRAANPIKRVKDPNHPNFKRKTWKECFLEALQSESMKQFVKNWGVDCSNWKGMTKETVNETFKTGNGWSVYEGTNYITTIFENGKEISFELTFRNKIREDKDKWRTQAASKWSGIAKEIYNNPELNEIGNPKQKSWEECFSEALIDERMKPFIKETDRTPVFDPVNFTPRV